MESSHIRKFKLWILASKLFEIYLALVHAINIIMICPGIKVTTYISASDLCPIYISTVMYFPCYPIPICWVGRILFVDKKFLKAREHRFCLVHIQYSYSPHDSYLIAALDRCMEQHLSVATTITIAEEINSPTNLLGDQDVNHSTTFPPGAPQGGGRAYHW